MAYSIGQQIGNYTLVRLIGQGAFGSVYLGEHRYLERLAAIKVLHVRMGGAGSHESFRCEARTIAQLNHPHIIGVYDFGIYDETPYLVMEYVPNGTLRSLHPKGTCLPFEQIVTYVKQIASALDYAHEQHVIHRDIKPENVLLNTKHEVVLSDFGIAVMQPTMESLSIQKLAGTPLYMAPEQIQGRPCAASDQYALGVMVYEWLCGEPPFHGTLFEVFNCHLHEPPPSLCARFPQLPPAVEDAVLGALAKNSQHRFLSVQDFATVLEEAFFATQLLWSDGSVEHKIEDETTLSLARVRLVPVSSPSGQNHIDEVTQPLHKGAPALEEQTLVPSFATRPAHGILDSPIVSTLGQHQKPTSALQTRQRLLRRVRSFWITGVLEQSLHGVALIALGLQEQPDALANPWHLVLQHPDTIPRPLSTGTRITQVYDDADGEILILGAPGSGKTTLLLELTRDLLERAERDEEYSMPVVFNLSSWATKQQPLVDWFVEELVSKYQVPRRLSRTLVDANQILPLLDGLDEVALKSRTACIEAINSYRQEHGFLPLVVSSRSADYLEQTTRIQLRSALSIQPFTDAQVDQYLASGGEQLLALRLALQQDATLRELTSSPLLLSILTLAYHGKPVKDLLAAGAPEMRRQQVFTLYVQRMIERRGGKARYKPEQTVHWLALLAVQLMRRGQTQFYIEHMQPDWLPGRLSRWLYYAIAIKPIDALIGILVGVLIGSLHYSYVGALVYGLVGLLVTLLVGRRGVDRPSGKPTESWRRFIRVMPLFIGAITELVVALSYEMMQGVSLDVNDVLVNLLVGTLIGLVVGVLMSVRKIDIRPVEIVIWSWSRFVKIKHLRNGLLAGLVFGTINALIFLPSGPFLGLFGVLAGWLLSGLLDGLSSDSLDSRRRVVPNQGIKRSARNGLLIGLILGLATGLILGLYLELASALFIDPTTTPLYGVLYGMVYGLGIGLLAWLFGGGDAYIKHLVLRLLLSASGSIPWNYPRFLNHAAERILLRNVGGGYMFVHRLLQEYFASSV